MLFLHTYIKFSKSYLFMEISDYQYRRYEINITGNYSITSINNRLTYLLAIRKSEKILLEDFPIESDSLKSKYNDVGLWLIYRDRVKYFLSIYLTSLAKFILKNK